MKTVFTSIAGLVLLGGVLAGEFGEINIDMDFAGRLMPRATSTNLQTFTGALGGATADPITSSGDSSRPFEVDGDTFTDFPSAAGRSCDNQHNACATLANKNPSEVQGGVPACDTQLSSCSAAISTATKTSFATLFSTDANFEYFCDP